MDIPPSHTPSERGQLEHDETRPSSSACGEEGLGHALEENGRGVVDVDVDFPRSADSLSPHSRIVQLEERCVVLERRNASLEAQYSLLKDAHELLQSEHESLLRDEARKEQSHRMEKSSREKPHAKERSAAKQGLVEALAWSTALLGQRDREIDQLENELDLRDEELEKKEDEMKTFIEMVDALEGKCQILQDQLKDIEMRSVEGQEAPNNTNDDGEDDPPHTPSIEMKSHATSIVPSSTPTRIVASSVPTSVRSSVRLSEEISSSFSELHNLISSMGKAKGLVEAEHPSNRKSQTIAFHSTRPASDVWRRLDDILAPITLGEEPQQQQQQQEEDTLHSDSGSIDDVPPYPSSDDESDDDSSSSSDDGDSATVITPLDVTSKLPSAQRKHSPHGNEESNDEGRRVLHRKKGKRKAKRNWGRIGGDELENLEALSSMAESQFGTTSMSKMIDTLQDARKSAPSDEEDALEEEAQSASLSTTHRQADKRARVILELIETERTYLEKLVALHGFFVTPVMRLAQGDANVLAASDVEIMFSNWEDLIGVSSHFRTKLEQEVKRYWRRTFAGAVKLDSKHQADACLGDAPLTGMASLFLTTMDLFASTYTPYITNYKTAYARLRDITQNNPGFLNFLLHYIDWNALTGDPNFTLHAGEYESSVPGRSLSRTNSHKHVLHSPIGRKGRTLTLRSKANAAESSDHSDAGASPLQDVAHSVFVLLSTYLVLPIQRLPRYLLLLRELMDATPVDHEGRDQLNTAAAQMESLLEKVEYQSRRRNIEENFRWHLFNVDELEEEGVRLQEFRDEDWFVAKKKANVLLILFDSVLVLAKERGGKSSRRGVDKSDSAFIRLSKEGSRSQRPQGSFQAMFFIRLPLLEIIDVTPNWFTVMSASPSKMESHKSIRVNASSEQINQWLIILQLAKSDCISRVKNRET